MSDKTFTATFSGGTFSRRSASMDYTHATYRHGKVAFHTSVERARARGGEVVRVEVAGKIRTATGTPMAIEEPGKIPTGCTIRSAVSGECGKPVVKTFEVGGRVYGECARHSI